MPNGQINTKGRLERGAPQTNRSLLRYNEALARLNAAFYPIKAKGLKVKGKPVKVKSKPVVKSAQPEIVSPENIVKSIHDKLPLSKFAGNTVNMFKGKTYLYMAKEYPKIMMRFIRERKELVFASGVLDELIRQAKNE